jgi:hypothetical protein
MISNVMADVSINQLLIETANAKRILSSSHPSRWTAGLFNWLEP